MFAGLGGAGSTPTPVHGALAAGEVQRVRAGSARVPDNVIAAACDERSLRRLRRRIRRWSLLHRIR